VKSWNSSSATYVTQPARRPDREIQEAVIVSGSERATANGEKHSDEIATMTAPLVVPERADSTMQNKP